MADNEKMPMTITDRGIVAGEKVVGGILALFVGKQSGGDIASGLGDIARIGVEASSSDKGPPALTKDSASDSTFYFRGK